METLTYELPISRTVYETKQIPLPLYRKHPMFAYKVIDKERCLMITHKSMFGPKIETASASMAFQFSETQDCSEGEFDALFNSTLAELQSLAVA